nr:VPLPA-CTERM-specific exosortase XrtD [Parvularcula mediterranea]
MAALVVVVAFLFHEGFANLWDRWGRREELSHSYFIPAITAWMLWDRREALKASIGAPSWIGAAVLAFGVLTVAGYQTTHIFLIEHLGIIISAFGLALLIGGQSLFRQTFFPLAYLIFMIPPPFWIITVTSWQFQLWSSELGVAMIRFFDVPVLLRGNVIELGNITLQVVEACSGLRYLFPFLSLGALAAYFYRGPLWQRALVLLSTIPITIVMNSFRIAMTGILSDRYGPSHTEGFLHFFEGWVVFLMCIALLLVVLVTLARFSGKKNVLATLGLPHAEAIRPAAAWTRERFMLVAGATTAAVAVFAVLLHTTEDELIAPDRETFAQLPLEFEGWQVRETALDVATEEALGADDYIVMNLVDPEDREVYNLYIAYLEAQRDGRSWHSPRQCLPGGGWTFDVQEIIAEGPQNVLGHAYNRIIMSQGETRYLVYYWYDQRGRTFADEIWMKIVLIWDVATKRRSDGAMIRMMTPIAPDETIEEAETRLQNMRVETLTPILPKYIPS